MKPTNTYAYVAWIGAAVVGLATGLGLAQRRTALQTQALSSPAPATAPAEAGLRSNAFRKSLPQASETQRLVDRLERRLAREAGHLRRLAWLEALEHATSSDFPELARLAREDAPAIQALASRWAEINPQHLFQTLLAEHKHPQGLPVHELSRVLFDQWPRQNPEQAIAALQGTPDREIAWPWRITVATAVIQQDVELGLQLFAQWQIDNHLPFADGRGPLPKWAGANPRHAAELALKNPAGFLTQTVLEVIGQEWGKTDPTSALRFATTTGGQSGSTLGQKALESWAEHDRTAAAAWLASADPTARHQLSPGFAEAWAATDPARALSWCQENLAGTSLTRAVSAIVEGAGPKRVAETAALVAAMEPSSARAAAAASVARQWFPSLGGTEGPSGNRVVTPETLAWLGSLDSVSLDRVLQRESWSWATSDPSTMADFLLAKADQPLGDWPELVLARQWARQAPTQALEWTQRLPQQRALGTGGEAYAEWRSAQPEAATRWLADLPADDPRRTEFFRSHIRSLAYDARATDQLAAMNPPDRARAQVLLQEMNDLPAEVRARLLETVVTP